MPDDQLLIDKLPTIITDRSDKRLAGVFAKLDRADEHLRTIEAEWASFVESKPLAYTMHLDQDATSYRVTVTVKRRPPARFSAVAGDAIHDLRSPLDHLAGLLVKRPKGLTAFPIYSDPDDFRCKVRLPAVRNRFGPLTGLTVDSEPWQIIERSQPFNGEHGAEHNILATVARLSNLDKHRALLAQSAAHGEPKGIRVEGDGFEATSRISAKWGATLKTGDEVLSGKCRVTKPDAKPQAYGVLPLSIKFGEGRGKTARFYELEDFAMMRNAVHAAVELLRGFVGHG